MNFLPISKKDIKKRGWEQLDFVFVVGDAYVDHPSFGHAIISRLLEAEGYKVGIIAQPDWKNADEFKKLGKPRLGFLVSSGNVDSMVNHYSVFKKRRKKDYYSPGGKKGLRPDRAVTVYCNKIREAYKDVPIIIGGIEASLRRFGHYDYWDNKVRRSILMDSRADIAIYGMGEKPIVEIADALQAGIDIKDITWIKGTVYKQKELDNIKDCILLPCFKDIQTSKEKYAKSFMKQYTNQNHYSGKPLAEPYDKNLFIVQNPPPDPQTKEEMDRVYRLPYVRDYHPIYREVGGIPALEEVKFSITSNRGCFGGCHFCALSFHQGRVIQCRSVESIIEEGKKLVQDKDFKGYIHDVGGPTANFRHAACSKQEIKGACTHKDCLYPKACDNLKIDHKEYVNILKQLKSIEGVKKVFVRSGIRFDYAIYDKDTTFLNELIQHHISGYLKIAPEHVSDEVLYRMGKPSKDIYEKFVNKFNQLNKKHNKKQFIIPYFISSHPGSTLKHAIELGVYLKETGFVPDQVQDFYPTPSTLSTCMYYTGYDPLTMEKVYVPKSMEEKQMQRALLHFNKPENYDLVLKALKKENRTDLIGYVKHCLIPPLKRRGKNEYHKKTTKHNRKQSKRI